MVSPLSAVIIATDPIYLLILFRKVISPTKSTLGSLGIWVSKVAFTCHLHGEYIYNQSTVAECEKAYRSGEGFPALT